jgi:hypothetical protein
MWNDFMPGKRPAFHAVCSAQIENASSADVVLRDAVATISGVPDLHPVPYRGLHDEMPRMVNLGEDRPLRRFFPEILVKNEPVRELRIPAKSTVECTFRTPATGVHVIDTTSGFVGYEFSVRMLSSLHSEFIIKKSLKQISVTR